MNSKATDSRPPSAYSVALIAESPSSFVNRDGEILSERYDVTRVWYRGKRDLPRLVKSVITTSINISWFALGYAYTAGLISKFLRKPNVIIAGGFDVVYEPEIGYGAMGTPRRVRMTTRALESATLVIAVSESSKAEVLQWVDRDVSVVPNGVDPTVFVPKGPKTSVVVTVANLDNQTKVRVKGIDHLATVAKRIPDIQFRLIGRVSPDMFKWLRETLPSNVEFLGYLQEPELVGELQRAQVYFQPSFRESFGVAVAEAMACECVPVVSDRKALPELVGNTGFVCSYSDPRGMVAAIHQALSSRGDQARLRILDRFTLARRKATLLKLLDGLGS